MKINFSNSLLTLPKSTIADVVKIVELNFTTKSNKLGKGYVLGHKEFIKPTSAKVPRFSLTPGDK